MKRFVLSRWVVIISDRDLYPSEALLLDHYYECRIALGIQKRLEGEAA